MNAFVPLRFALGEAHQFDWSDEFVAILQVGHEELQELSQRIQRAIDLHDFGFQGSKLFIGLSIGGASFGVDERQLMSVLLGGRPRDVCG